MEQAEQGRGRARKAARTGSDITYMRGAGTDAVIDQRFWSSCWISACGEGSLRIM